MAGNTTRSEANQSFFVVVRDPSTGVVKRVAIPGDVQIGLGDRPSELHLLGRLSLATKVYTVNSASKGVISIKSEDTVAALSLQVTPVAARITCSLPSDPRDGQIHFIKDYTGTAATVPIDIVPQPGVTIDDSTSKTVSTAYGSMALVWLQNQWRVLVTNTSSSAGGSGGSGADPGATYIVVSTTSSLAQERALQAGYGIRLQDGGANGNLIVSFTGNLSGAVGAADPGAAFVTIGNTSSLSNERALSVGYGLQMQDGGANSSVIISLANSISSSADVSASYITIGNTSSLPNERQLQAGYGLSLQDGGANDKVIISFTGNLSGSTSAGADVSASYITISNTGSLPNERALQAGYGVSLQDGGAGGNVIISFTGNLSASTGGGADVSASYITIGNTGSLPNERALQAGYGIGLQDGGAGGGIIVSFTGNLSGSVGSGADSEAAYITIANTSSLSNERQLQAGYGLSIQDGGANDKVIISFTGNLSGSVGGGSGASTSASYVVISADSGLSDERVLTAGTGITITDGGAGGNVVISATGSVTNITNNVSGAFAVASTTANYFAVTSSNNYVIPTGSTFVGVPNVTGTITTTGYPVFLSANVNWTSLTNGSVAAISITRDGTVLGHSTGGNMIVGPTNATYNQNASFCYVDYPPSSGTYTYSLVACEPTGSGQLTAFGCGPAALMAFEMKGANVVTASITTETAVPGGDITGLSASITPTRGPILAIASVDYAGDTANSWARGSIYRAGTNLGGSTDQVLAVASNNNESTNFMMMFLDQPSPTGSYTYTVRATNGSGTGKISKGRSVGTLILWELLDSNWKTATSTATTALGSGYTDVVPSTPPLLLSTRGRPVLMGHAGQINTTSTTGRSGWSFLRNGSAITTSSKGTQIVDGEGSNDWNRVTSQFWIDPVAAGMWQYQIAGFNISGSQGQNQTPAGISTFFVYELDAGPSLIAAGWVDTGNKLSTTASVAISGAPENTLDPSTKGQDVYFYVSGTIGLSGSTGKRSLFGGDVVVSGSTYVKNTMQLTGSTQPNALLGIGQIFMFTGSLFYIAPSENGGTVTKLSSN